MRVARTVKLASLYLSFCRVADFEGVMDRSSLANTQARATEFLDFLVAGAVERQRKA
jgi:hypothetical protein